MANKFKLNKMANAADKAMDEALEIAANDAEQHFKKSFKDGGFNDNVLERWQPRKNQVFGGIARTRRNHPNTKPTLVGKKVLMNSIKKRRINGKKRILSSDLPYSAIHNEGLMGRAWGKYSFKMPKRKFLGNSRNLEKRTEAKIIAKINTALMNA